MDILEFFFASMSVKQMQMIDFFNQKYYLGGKVTIFAATCKYTNSLLVKQICAGEWGQRHTRKKYRFVCHSSFHLHVLCMSYSKRMQYR